MDVCVFVEPEQGTTIHQMLDLACRAEDLGFAGFYSSDHILPLTRKAQRVPARDVWMTLTAIAARTERIEIGSMMSSATFRHPGMLTVASATLHEISHGRSTLGIGAGWFEAEHHAYGIAYPPQAERFERLEEQFRIIRRLFDLGPDERLTFSGKHYDLLDCPGPFSLAEHSRPRLIAGGLGQRHTPRIAASFADEFNVPPSAPDVAPRLFESANAACRELGRDPRSLDLSAGLVVCCGRTASIVDRRLAAVISSMGYSPESVVAQGGVGNPASLRRRLERFAADGAKRAYLQLFDLGDLEHLDDIASAIR